MPVDVPTSDAPPITKAQIEENWQRWLDGDITTEELTALIAAAYHAVSP